jgi:hypothetical protein
VSNTVDEAPFLRVRRQITYQTDIQTEIFWIEEATVSKEAKPAYASMSGWRKSTVTTKAKGLAIPRTGLWEKG